MSRDRDLARGLAAYERGDWNEAYQGLTRAEAVAPIAAADLESLAVSAYLVGREQEYLTLQQRAYQRHLDDGAIARAAYCACWSGLTLAVAGAGARATGWFGRAVRLLESLEDEAAAQGYLLLADAQRELAAGRHDEAHASGARAVAVGQRERDDDLVVLALHLMGVARLRQARVAEGLELLDEAMVGVASGRLSPQVPGIVYCTVIDACHRIYSLRRAQEWTQVLSDWCERQPDLVAFTGRCRVHRAEMLMLHGAWGDAIREAGIARERVEGRSTTEAAGVAAASLYQQGEVHRLRGEDDAAEAAYREANRAGRQPQPGLALLRLAQGEVDAAAIAIRRRLGEVTDPLARARLLPAQVEIALADGAREEARAAAAELERTAATYGTPALATMAAHAEGAILLAAGDVAAALPTLRSALRGWRELDAPYPAARVRVLLARTCLLAQDEEAARLERDAARSAFQALGAARDLERLEQEEAEAAAPSGRPHLTPRETQVLRRLASGAKNKAIAAELSISERTVDRHVSNIFDKLQVASRTEAAAYAYRHGLV